MSSPKVFISYSWTSPGYKELVLDIADRLMKDDGISVIIDEYDLHGGQDVVAFMERLRTDTSITHCLVLSDAAYAKKADGRNKGVGTEAQIISADVYNDIGQTRIVPILMERSTDGEPCLPTFLRSRMYFDFSSTESMHRDWEKLCRHLWGKPSRSKPLLGDPPKYLNEAGGLFVGMKRTYQALRVGLMDGKPSIPVYREELLDSFEHELVAASSVTLSPDATNDEIMNHWENCLRVQIEARDLLIDWVRIEARIDAERAATACIVPILERISLLPRASESAPAAPSFRDAMAVLGYEMALYVVACLIEVDSAAALKRLLAHPFHERSAYQDRLQICLRSFSHYSRLVDVWNQKQERRWISPIAKLIIERCTHAKLGQLQLMEAEALLFLVNLLKGAEWYPYSAAYASYGVKFPWFLRARSGSVPDRLAVLTDLGSWQIVRDEFHRRFAELTRSSVWEVFQRGRNYTETMALNSD